MLGVLGFPIRFAPLESQVVQLPGRGIIIIFFHPAFAVATKHGLGLKQREKPC